MSHKTGICVGWAMTARKLMMGAFALGASCLFLPGDSVAAVLAGKLWVVPFRDATFPPPTARPDATFTTDHVNFIGECAENTNTAVFIHCAIGDFLLTSRAIEALRFSGLKNPILGAPVTVATPLNNGVGFAADGTFETFIELTGFVSLVHGQRITISHDDGVSLKIDGALIPGFTTGPTVVTETIPFSGTTGVHSIDLVYGSTGGGPELLIFGPAP